MPLNLLKASLYWPLSALLQGTTLAILVTLGSGCATEDDPEDAASPSPTASAQPLRAPVEPSYREPVAPPNPATHRLPMDNPGGLNRYRPERKVPGLD